MRFWRKRDERPSDKYEVTAICDTLEGRFYIAASGPSEDSAKRLSYHALDISRLSRELLKEKPK